MSDRESIEIALTRDQQLELLAATGLQFRVVQVPLDSIVAGGEAVARLPLPEWLRWAAAASLEGEEVNSNVRKADREDHADPGAAEADPGSHR